MDNDMLTVMELMINKYASMESALLKIKAILEDRSYQSYSVTELLGMKDKLLEIINTIPNLG